MDDRDGSVTARIRRFGERFGESDESESSAESGWKRYGWVVQLLVIVGTAFGGVIVGIGSTALDRTSSFARTAGPELLDALWPVLIAVTAVAVAVCVVVVVLGVRNA